MHAIDEDYVTVAEVATLLRVAPSTIRRWIREGDVPAYRVGRRRVALKRDDLSTLITPARPDMGTVNTMTDDERLEIRRLTPDEQRRALETMDRIREINKEILARRKGKPFSPSWKVINEIRDERTRQLS